MKYYYRVKYGLIVLIIMILMLSSISSILISDNNSNNQIANVFIPGDKLFKKGNGKQSQCSVCHYDANFLVEYTNYLPYLDAGEGIYFVESSQGEPGTSVAGASFLAELMKKHPNLLWTNQYLKAVKSAMYVLHGKTADLGKNYPDYVFKTNLLLNPTPYGLAYSLRGSKIVSIVSNIGILVKKVEQRVYMCRYVTTGIWIFKHRHRICSIEYKYYEVREMYLILNDLAGNEARFYAHDFVNIPKYSAYNYIYITDQNGYIIKKIPRYAEMIIILNPFSGFSKQYYNSKTYQTLYHAIKAKWNIFIGFIYNSLLNEALDKLEKDPYTFISDVYNEPKKDLTHQFLKEFIETFYSSLALGRSVKEAIIYYRTHVTSYAYTDFDIKIAGNVDLVFCKT